MTRVTVTGATSIIGHFLIPTLEKLGAEVRAISRNPPVDPLMMSPTHVTQWLRADVMGDTIDFEPDEILIHLAPIWTLGHLIEKTGTSPQRLIAFSSTSRFSKINSTSTVEQEIAAKLAHGENQLMVIAQEKDITWTLFRPTLIYGAGLDQNVSKIARTIKNLNLFPLPGKGRGKRMPVHANDLANACIEALKHPASQNQAYNLSGGETLTYHEMVSRIFDALGKPERIFPIPEKALRSAIQLLSYIPKFRDIKAEMIDRMNQDLTFDCSKAKTDFGYSPRAFNPTQDDLIENTTP